MPCWSRWGEARARRTSRAPCSCSRESPQGLVSLWLIGTGFTAYALWRLSEAALGVIGARLVLVPGSSHWRAVIYAGLAYLRFEVTSGTGSSQSRQQQDMTATAMQHPPGRWAVSIAGLIVVSCGLALVVEGARQKFMKFLRTAQMSARTRRVIELGRRQPS